MKQHISFADLMTLSETAKGALNNLWQPQCYDLAALIVCQDVENDLYE